MRFLLTDQLLREAEQFGLRLACIHCLFYSEADGRCAHGWPNELQRRWPLALPQVMSEVMSDATSGDAPDAAPDAGAAETRSPAVVSFCKEFELR